LSYCECENIGEDYHAWLKQNNMMESEDGCLIGRYSGKETIEIRQFGMCGVKEDKESGERLDCILKKIRDTEEQCRSRDTRAVRRGIMKSITKKE
jgi:hypothetical protein